MIVLADNDIILKLAQCDLLDSLSELLGEKIEEIFIPSTAKYQLLSKSHEKALVKCGNEETVSRIKRFLEVAQDVPAIENLELLSRLAQTPGIHAGEQQLFAASIGNDSLLLTGDRNALRAVLASKAANSDLHDALIDSVVTFESALLLALEIYGFVVLKQKLLACPKPDGVLKLVLRSDMTEHALKECLVSYSKEVTTLLAFKDRLPSELR